MLVYGSHIYTYHHYQRPSGCERPLVTSCTSVFQPVLFIADSFRYARLLPTLLVYSWIHLIRCLPLFRTPSVLPIIRFLPIPSLLLITCPKQVVFLIFRTNGSFLFYFITNASRDEGGLIIPITSVLRTLAVQGMRSTLLQHLTSKAFIPSLNYIFIQILHILLFYVQCSISEQYQ